MEHDVPDPHTAGRIHGGKRSDEEHRGKVSEMEVELRPPDPTTLEPSLSPSLLSLSISNNLLCSSLTKRTNRALTEQDNQIRVPEFITGGVIKPKHNDRPSGRKRVCRQFKPAVHANPKEEFQQLLGVDDESVCCASGGQIRSYDAAVGGESTGGIEGDPARVPGIISTSGVLEHAPRPDVGNVVNETGEPDIRLPLDPGSVEADQDPVIIEDPRNHSPHDVKSDATSRGSSDTTAPSLAE